MTSKHWALICFGLTVLAVLVFLPVMHILEVLAYWAESQERAAALVFVAAFVGAVILMIPVSVMMILAGFLFGLPRGVALVLLAYAVATPLAFLIARHLAHDWIKEKVLHRPRFAALDRAVHRNGFVAAMLARLAQVFPYNVLNYAFGLTSIRLSPYLAGTLVGSLPTVVLLVLLGSQATTLKSALEGGLSIDRDLQTLALLSVALLILLLVLVRRITLKHLGRKTRESNL